MANRTRESQEQRGGGIILSPSDLSVSTTNNHKNEHESIGLITVKEDFEGVTEYQGLSDADKDKVWKYAQRKLIDYLMQDYQLSLEACVSDALRD